MLVLTRKIGEKIHIGDDVTLTVVEVTPGRVRIGFDAPSKVRIFRHELLKDPGNSSDEPKN